MRTKDEEESVRGRGVGRPELNKAWGEGRRGEGEGWAGRGFYGAVVFIESGVEKGRGGGGEKQGGSEEEFGEEETRARIREKEKEMEEEEEEEVGE